MLCITWNLYSEGLGVSQSNHDAVIWEIRAASEGSAEAQNMMGFRHEIGLGMSRNQSMALDWYLKAAVQGHAGAKESVARLGRNEPPPRDSRDLFSNGGAPSFVFHCPFLRIPVIPHVRVFILHNFFTTPTSIFQFRHDLHFGCQNRG